MELSPPAFTGKEDPDAAEEWVRAISEIFEILEVPAERQVSFATYRLQGDAKSWWETTREVRYMPEERRTLTWEEFTTVFMDTYFPQYARDRKKQEFLDLRQGSMKVAEYTTRFRHLEKYCPHTYTTDEARAKKYVQGLRDGLRTRVLTSRPQNLNQAIEMATILQVGKTRTNFLVFFSKNNLDRS